MGVTMLCVTKDEPVATAEGDTAAGVEEEVTAVEDAAATAAAVDDGVGAAAAVAAAVDEVDVGTGVVGVDEVEAAVAAKVDAEVAVLTTDAAAVVTTAAYDGVMLLLDVGVEEFDITSGGHSSSRWNRVHLMHPTLKWRSLQPP